VPPAKLLHPGREAAVGPRLLIRRETPAYLAANLYIWRSFHYPLPVDALSCSFSYADLSLYSKEYKGNDGFLDRALCVVIVKLVSGNSVRNSDLWRRL